MRRVQSFALMLVVCLAASTAAATTTEPSGLQVPLDSANGEEQLYSMFANLGDPVDWQADSHSTPNQFSPLCGFTATFVLHQSGCTLDFAWYNETGAPPQQSDLHVIIPAGSPIGQTFTGTDIKNDPNYQGGLVGFAILANGFCSQNHFANPAWNPEYSPGVPWIAAVIYPSRNTPNAYYIAFEDGPMVGTSFNNDGDFNDHVFFLTGLTCSGGGQACDTGLPGICAAGVTQCTANGVVCQGLSTAAPVETCNGLDDDCNGQVDEGDICASGFVCDRGTCVKSCSSGEFSCLAGLVCNASGYCVDPACKDMTCPSGQVCAAGVCKGPCDGVVCPYPQVCRVGACVDPCAGLTCDSGQVCDAGVCKPPCDCLPCGGGTSCEASSGLCIESACVGSTCGAGTHCVGGQCVDDCAGATCPAGQTCQTGQCVGTASSSSGPSTGAFVTSTSGSGTNANGAGAGAGGGSGAGGANAGGGGAGAGTTGGCACGVDDRGADAWLAVFGAGLAIAGLRRRRR